MKKGLAVLAFVGALAGGAVLLNLGEAVPVSEIRPARIPCEKIQKGDCPAGVIERNDFCLCLTHKKTGELTDEKTVGDYRCDVCEVTDPEAGKHLVVRYPKSAKPLEPGCETMADGLLLPGISMHNIPTGIEAQLEAKCAPCKIGSDSWGQCPECAHSSRNDCGKFCKEESDAL